MMDIAHIDYSSPHHVCQNNFTNKCFFKLLQFVKRKTSCIMPWSSRSFCSLWSLWSCWEMPRSRPKPTKGRTFGWWSFPTQKQVMILPFPWQIQVQPWLLWWLTTQPWTVAQQSSFHQGHLKWHDSLTEPLLHWGFLPLWSTMSLLMLMLLCTTLFPLMMFFQMMQHWFYLCQPLEPIIEFQPMLSWILDLIGTVRLVLLLWKMAWLSTPSTEPELWWT